ncbi:uncharacterized protein [Primulina huaijiensis]|uniref:uncharacterized protein isoform X1 n=1 Tax=Primulina huaijiensis TaxID=1492673 RepID=UPI003CC76DB8
MLKEAALVLPVPSPGIRGSSRGGTGAVTYSRRRLSLKLHNRPRFASSTVQSVDLSSAVGSSPQLRPYQYTFTHRHIHVLSFIACGVAISATWLFCSAIPTLLAFRRAAESLEKLMDATREELPDTMAAIRLSGMEISDLTTELNDLGQEITQGIRNSTRAVRVTEERLRQLTDMTPSTSVQVVAPKETGIHEPSLARSARGAREGIVKGRATIKTFFTLAGFSMKLLSYLRFRAKASI